jgi:sec-independent protein translocase protein TatC
VGAGIGFWQRTAVEAWIQAPLHGPLYYTAPSAGFQYVILVCLAVGAVLAIPIALYQAVAFLAPAAPQVQLRRHGGRVVLAATALAALGVAFAYYLLLPTALRFFAGFAVGGIHPLISTGEYLSFMVGCLVTCALLFQLPLVLLLIDRITPLPPRRLMRYQGHVIVGSLALALALPFTYDPVSQFLIAAPIVGLYELSLIVLWWRYRSVSHAYRRRVQPAVPSAPTVVSLAAAQPDRPERALAVKPLDHPRLVRLG